ncbi:hypothetical protein Aperf_G00000060138 [Anoplocephala perfoliata]
MDTSIYKYEGAEKLLEIWFFTKSNRGLMRLMEPDLRQLSREDIVDFLNLANCTIVNEHKNDQQLSFILSESSLFITSDRVILKTCGRTLILKTLWPLIHHAKRLGFSDYVIYYSRRSFLFPELQHAPYRDFRIEVCPLLLLYGAPYTFGRLNGNCWNFYYGQSTLSQLTEPPGQTLELMMRDLNSGKMEVFYTNHSSSAEEATKNSGIADLFPWANISAFLFNPCGYSANGLMKEDEYFTVHITPEPEFSYASFETNVPMENYPAFISRVLDIFQPNSFICTFFSDSRSDTYGSHAILDRAMILKPGYKRKDFQMATLSGGRKLSYAEYCYCVPRRRTSASDSGEDSSDTAPSID